MRPPVVLSKVNQVSPALASTSSLELTDFKLPRLDTRKKQRISNPFLNECLEPLSNKQKRKLEDEFIAETSRASSLFVDWASHILRSSAHHFPDLEGVKGQGQFTDKNQVDQVNFTTRAKILLTGFV